MALGKDGQFIYVNPVTQIIIVRLGWSMGGLPLSVWVELFQTNKIILQARPSHTGLSLFAQITDMHM